MIFALAGNQNCGKTTLFNALTGANQRVGNFPGVTVDQKIGVIKNTDHQVVDLPGIYSIRPYTQEENITRDFILKEKPDAKRVESFHKSARLGGVMATVKQGPRILYLATILFGLLCLFAQQIGLFRMQRQLTKNAQNMDMIIDYRFGENAFDVTYPGQSESISYKDLQKIVETEGYYFLYTDIRMAHILPKKDFSQGSAAAFGKFLSEKSGLELLQHNAK